MRVMTVVLTRPALTPLPATRYAGTRPVESGAGDMLREAGVSTLVNRIP